jgi:membrane protein implicated in regulation of membrane protease activity
MDWFRDHMWETWLGLAIVLGVAEMFSLDLILLMISAGALVGMVCDLVGLPFPVQSLAAAAAALASLTLIRPALVHRLHAGPSLQVGHGKLVGQTGLVTEAITANEPGRVKLAGEIWSASPYNGDTTIAPGQTVEVLEIRGATAYVVPITELES